METGSKLAWPRIIYHPTAGIKSECGTYTYKRCESFADFVPLMEQGWELYPPEQQARADAMDIGFDDEVSRETIGMNSFTDGFQVGDVEVQVVENGEAGNVTPEPPAIDPNDPPDHIKHPDGYEDPEEESEQEPEDEKPKPVKKVTKKKASKTTKKKASKK